MQFWLEQNVRLLVRREGELRQGPTPAVAELCVREAMEPDSAFAASDTELNDLRALMISQHQRYQPVVRLGVVADAVSFHDGAKSVYELVAE